MTLTQPRSAYIALLDNNIQGQQGHLFRELHWSIIHICKPIGVLLVVHLQVTIDLSHYS